MVDLHVHSRYSEEGEYSPIELIDLCCGQGISMMSITDRNCAKANMEAKTLAEEKGITYIAGIEIDCVYKETKFSVLGYGIDFHHSDFDQIEQNVERQNFQVSLHRLELTQELGFHITENDMWNVSKDCYWKVSWTGGMFAKVLLQKPEYMDHPLLSLYRAGGSRSDDPYTNFCLDFYAQGKLCYSKVEYPALEEVINLIHRNKGIAVLAHPAVNLKGKEFLLDEILRKGIDGIEVFSSYHTPKQAGLFSQITCERHMISTCGSGFYGKMRPLVSIGEYKGLISNKELVKLTNRLLDL